mmetsp:Transcript_63532/g.200918  ORF Transcript_63532/g.200918 Transcript_63532/m.200918 type:complete len:205 (+) Transcript_63532:722-1336(+)
MSLSTWRVRSRYRRCLTSASPTSCCSSLPSFSFVLTLFWRYSYASETDAVVIIFMVCASTPATFDLHWTLAKQWRMSRPCSFARVANLLTWSAIANREIRSWFMWGKSAPCILRKSTSFLSSEERNFRASSAALDTSGHRTSVLSVTKVYCLTSASSSDRNSTLEILRLSTTSWILSSSLPGVAVRPSTRNDTSASTRRLMIWQ